MNMDFPGIAYRRSAAGSLYPVLRGTGIRVQIQTIVMTAEQHTIAEIADDYDLTEAQIEPGNADS